MRVCGCPLVVRPGDQFNSFDGHSYHTLCNWKFRKSYHDIGYNLLQPTKQCELHSNRQFKHGWISVLLCDSAPPGGYLLRGSGHHKRVILPLHGGYEVQLGGDYPDEPERDRVLQVPQYCPHQPLPQTVYHAVPGYRHRSQLDISAFLHPTSHPLTLGLLLLQQKSPGMYVF